MMTSAPLPRLGSPALLVGAIGLALLAGACRGQESDAPPVHLNPNMDTQPRYDPQGESKFYEDRRTMRAPVDGTIPHGNLIEDDKYLTGEDGEQYVLKIPVPVTQQLLDRGRERYNIFCAPCHDATGYGNGLVVKRGFPQATNLHEERVRTMPDGQVYVAVAKGIRTMPSYGAQIPVADRWAIVAYVRALELSQNATLDDVPSDKRGSLPVENP